MNQGFEAFERGFVRLSDAAQRRGDPFRDAGQFLQVERAACFRTRTGHTVSAERLYADDGADDVTVDVNVTCFDAFADAFDRAFDAAVYAAGKRVAFAVDLVDDLVKFVGAVADNVQHRAEDFAGEFVQVVELEQNRQYEGGFRRINVGSGFDFVIRLGNAFHFVDVRLQVLLRFGIDDGAYVGGELNGFADDQFVHRAFDDGEHLVGNIFLNAKDAKGGAALSRAIESGVEYVQANLLGQRGGIDNHGVLTAGFGNQYGAVVAFGKGFVNQLCHFGRTGENHAADAWFKSAGKVQTALKEFDAVIMRTDPPFDMQYLYATQLLTLAEQQGAKVFNSGQAMRDFNEKLAILNFSRFTAPTLVTTRSADVRAFLKEHGDIIIKPLDGMGGMGIFRLTEKDPNIGSILETLMQLDSRTIMAQRYIPEIVHGDKRILIIGGEVVPYALARIPQNGETRGNLAAGGRGVAQELSERDREIAETLAPELKRRGILLAGLDVIGSNLTEVNVTSPTGFQEIMKQKGFDVAAVFADAVAEWSVH